MKPAAERVQQILDELGIESQIVEFSESTKTSAEAAAAIGTTVSQICKSILFEAGGEPIMVIASGANRIDTAKVQQHVGQPLGKATASFVREKTGYAIGGVPPVGHLSHFPIFIDRDLLQYDQIYAAGGTPNAIFPITPADLVRMTKGEVIDCRQE
ncbi:MAG: YbaK/EbsC family protein [Chloroflexota bacterium]|nr:YbaK/EbsC family protein [Chloroflexota bacterium]